MPIRGTRLHRDVNGPPMEETVRKSPNNNNLSDHIVFELPPHYAVIYGTPNGDALHGGRALFGSIIYAGDGADVVYAGSGDDIVYGGNHRDRLYGQDGNDFLDGGAGMDFLDGGSGADVMAGGTDNDWYIVDDFGDNVVENFNEGWDHVESHISSYTLPANVESLSLRGSAANGYGNGLDNRIDGNAANNSISGGAGHDQLFGADGNDWISGDDGNDFIVGGTGKDILVGGAGADTFKWWSTSETGGSPNKVEEFWGVSPDMDEILDFNPLEGDRIDLRNLAYEAGLAQLTFVGLTSPNSFTAPGQVGFEYGLDPRDITIWVNTDRDPQADAGIFLHQVAGTPDPSWFIL